MRYVSPRIRKILDPRCGRSAAVLGSSSSLLYPQNPFSARRQAVPSPVHCRGTDVAWLARDQKLEIARLHGADDYTNVDTSCLQYGTLLDMGFQPMRPFPRGRDQWA